MKFYTCILLFGLVAAASATFEARWRSRERGGCGKFCGLTLRDYQPQRNNGKCLGVFKWLVPGINAKFDIVKQLFNTYSNIGVAVNINVAMETCINLSRGMAVMINAWIGGLGDILANLIIGISRLLFCVLNGNNGNIFTKWLTLGRSSPAVCNKDFGLKWGWKRFIFGYTWDDILEGYDLYDIRAQVEVLLKTKGLKISALTGTYKVIVDNILKLNSILQRKRSLWKKVDYVDVTTCLITISAAVGSGYRVGIGEVMVDEFVEYLEPCYKKEFNVEIVSKTTIIKKEIQQCDTVTLGEALVVDVNVDVNVKSGNGNQANQDDQNKNGGRKTNVKTTEWETVYDDNGDVISSTKPDDVDYDFDV